MIADELRELADLLADPRLTVDDRAIVHATVIAICDTTRDVLDHRPGASAEYAAGVRRIMALERERIPLGLV